MNKKRLNEKLEASIIGGAIGDAMGIPLEYLPTEEIREKYGRVMEFLETRSNPHFRRKGFNKEGSGYISDDTLLTLGTLDGLSEAGNVDFDSICRNQIRYYESFPYGFGDSTANAFEAIKKGASYLETGNPQGTGNGIMMKQTPMAFYNHLKNIPDEEAAQTMITYSNVTHGNRISLVSAIVHNKMLIELMVSEGDLDKRKLLDSLIEIAEKYEQELVDHPYNGDDISVKLRELADCIGPDGSFSLTDEEILEKFGWGENNLGYSCYIYVTLPLMYALFLRRPDIEGFVDAINIGGDSDTFGAIIGNMIGAYRGRFYDVSLEEGLRDIDKIKERIKVFQDEFIEKCID